MASLAAKIAVGGVECGGARRPSRAVSGWKPPSRTRLGSKAMPACSSAWRYRGSRSRADSRSARPARKPIRRWPSPIRYSTAETAPRKFSESTVGGADERTLWSTATTGEPAAASTLVGVTRMTPSVSVPDPREERRSQPAWSRWPQPEKTTRSKPVPWIALGYALEQLRAERLDVGTRTPITFVRLLRRLWPARLAW